MRESRVKFLETTFSILQYKMAYKALQLVKEEMCIEKGYKRHNGKHFYYHLVDVTIKLINLGVRDEDILTAALLHDLVEDVPKYSISDVKDMFNENVAHMVELLTKDPNIDYKTDKEALKRYLQRISENLGASLIKCCDRLHNMGTLLDATPEKRLRQADETQGYFIPFLKVCRNLHTWYAGFFFDSKTTLESQIEIILDNHKETEILKAENESLQAEVERLRKQIAN